MIDLRGVTRPNTPAADIRVNPVIDVMVDSFSQQPREAEVEAGVAGGRDDGFIRRHREASQVPVDHDHVDGMAPVWSLEALIAL